MINNHLNILVDFINDPKMQRDESSCTQVVKAISWLASNKAIVKLAFDGSNLCSLCSQLIQQREEYFILDCSHSVHQQCFKTRFRQIGYDQTRYKEMQCSISTRCANYQVGKKQAFQAFDRKELEDYWANQYRQSIIRFAADDKLQRQKEIESKTFNCPRCKEDKIIVNEAITLDCDHRYCRKCVQAHVINFIGMGRFRDNEIVCSECPNVPIDANILKGCLPNHIFDQLMLIRLINIKSDNPNVRYIRCPGLVRIKPDGTRQPAGLNQKMNTNQQQEQGLVQAGTLEACVSLTEVDIVQFKVLKCTACTLKFCVHGCSDPHEGQTCQMYRQLKRMKQGSDNSFQLMIQNNEIKICPKCNMPIFRYAGCRYMYCDANFGGCAYEFCYDCRKHAPGRVYTCQCPGI